MRRIAAAMVITALAFAPATLAQAQTYPTVEPDGGGYSDQELADLVRQVLEELGLEPDVVETIVDDLLDGVTERINEMVDEGIVSTDQVDTLADLVDDGAFDQVIPERVDETRERRDAFRAAAEDILADLGIDTPGDRTIREILDEAGLTRDEFRDLLDDAGVELPPRPERDDRPDDGENPPPCGESIYPVTGPDAECRPPADGEGEGDRPTPPPPTTTAPVGDYPTTRPGGGEDRTPPPPPPSSDYPTTEPTPTTTVPPVGYPETGPSPAPEPATGGGYPSTGPSDPPRYPTTPPPARDGNPPPPEGDGTGEELF